MKVCFFGLGSIGQRHLRNLADVCGELGMPLEADAFRTGSCDGELSGVRHIRNEDELRAEYDAVFITNPTYMHYDTLLRHAHRAKNFFIEKAIFEKPYSIRGIGDKNIYTACPLRYTGVFLALEKAIAGMKVNSAAAVCASYLPSWRPGDYRTSYSAVKAHGGGVRLDLIHEMDYICALFGAPEDVFCACGKFSDLEIDSEDTAFYTLLYKDKIASIYLDYFSNIPQRDIKIRTDELVVHGDYLANTVAVYKRGDLLHEQRFDEEPNMRYRREMACFVDMAMNSGSNKNSAAHALRTLEFALR